MPENAESKTHKKSERVNINLPKARQQMRRTRELKQMRENHEDLFALLGTLLAIILILFIIMGGINQRALVESASQFAQTIGEKVANIFGTGEVITNSDGIYWQP